MITDTVFEKVIKISCSLINRRRSLSRYNKTELFFVSTRKISLGNIKASSTNGNRPVRQEPGKVICGFIPQEYFTAFFSKTGVTGFPTLVFTLGTYLISKEIYVLEHNFYNGLGILIISVIAVKKVGPSLAKYLDTEIDNYENSWKKHRSDEIHSLEEEILAEKKNQQISEGQLLLLDAKRFNVALQLEAEYRRRLYKVYQQVKQRLDFQVALRNAYRSIQHKNLVDWVVTEVKKQFNSEKDKEVINQCIQMLPEILKKEGMLE